jgi:hypothetical protein
MLEVTLSLYRPHSACQTYLDRATILSQRAAKAFLNPSRPPHAGLSKESEP